MMPNWDDLRAVLAVVRGSSLAAAADELGVTYTTVARRISRAEAALDEVLFERLADGYRPTEAGRLVARHAAEMDEADHRMMRALMGRDTRLTGPLVVTAPQLLIAHALAPVLDAFATQHPEVDLRIRASNDLLDLTRREADIAIRISRDPGDTLKGLRVTRQDRAGFAAPALAERIAADPAAPLDWLVYEGYPDLPDDLMRDLPGSRVRMRFDDMVAMAGAAAEGLGAVRMPMFLGRALPGLVPLPQVRPAPYADIWVVAHRDVWPSARLVAFREILVPFFRARRGLFVA